MIKLNTYFLIVSVILAILRVSSIVYKSISLNNIRVNNKKAENGEKTKNGDDYVKIKGAELHGPISDIILLIVSGLCIYKCCKIKKIKLI